ncbi:CUE domain protein Cue3, ASCC2-like protein, activating signal cointegrator 1 complex [Schizosaccharomyces osmophilus]|uniref:CUE domain protein Cue3, ASCC2-like protein, activating signal cointegrator 1 complex n=1 Tax=Schizosaccharomyces osmophilus TaxID=2545709 RepID=A0AAE9WEE4_9SCHI|nr:CUE domain protein Cue3, ASCC2-like protein, activating signal cointegrator 1 complex [Schizosaccharomyces osmophilus]WBW74812.1 CUE domain protein Cue3, ASCC2-like protein, activating signal cointegrator 1 complex [Schizosaccharomyces osmophilus]
MEQHVGPLEASLVRQLLSTKEDAWKNLAPAVVELVTVQMDQIWQQTGSLQLHRNEQDEIRLLYLLHRCLKTHKVTPKTIMQVCACFLTSSDTVKNLAWSFCKDSDSDGMALQFTQYFQRFETIFSIDLCRLFTVWTAVHCMTSSVYYPALLDLLPILSKVVQQNIDNPNNVAEMEKEFWLKRLVQHCLYHASDSSLLFYLEMFLDSHELQQCLAVILEDHTLLKRVKDNGNPEIRMMLDNALKHYRQAQAKQASAVSRDTSNTFGVDSNDIQNLVELFPQLTIEEAGDYLAHNNGQMDLACEAILTNSTVDASSSSSHPSAPSAPLKLNDTVKAVIPNRDTSSSNVQSSQEQERLDLLNIDPENIYVNKKPEDADFWKSSASSNQKARIFDLLALAEDDEYDDTYDNTDAVVPVDPGVQDDNPEAAPNIAHDYQRYINQVLLSAFERDPMLFEQSARKTKERADLIKQVDNAMTHEQIEGWRRMFTKDTKFASLIKREVQFETGNQNAGSLNRSKYRKSNDKTEETVEKPSTARPSRPPPNPALAKKKYVRRKPTKSSNEKK